MDTSNFPVSHPCYRSERKKVPGMFTDETAGEYIEEYVGLRTKSYGYSVCGIENIKAKGVRRHVIKNNLSLQDHKKCLFNEVENFNPFREMVSIRSYKHNIYTIKSNKLSLSSSDNKRFICQNKISTIPWGHYRLK